MAVFMKTVKYTAIPKSTKVKDADGSVIALYRQYAHTYEDKDGKRVPSVVETQKIAIEGETTVKGLKYKSSSSLF